MFEFPAGALQHDVAVIPSEFDCCEIISGGSSSKPSRQNRSSSSGSLKAEPASAMVQHTSTADRVKRELSDQGVSRKSQSSSAVVSQLSDTTPSGSTLQQKSDENVKSWAAVLAAGKNIQRPASASAAGGSQSDQPKPSESLSIKNATVNRPSGLKSVTESQSNKSKSRSATRDSDLTPVSLSDGASSRTKSDDRMSATHCESQSAAWITVSSHDRKAKSRSQTRQPHGDVSEGLTDSYAAVSPKQDKQEGRSTGGFDAAAAAAASSQSQSAAKQRKNKKKKKKSKGADVAVEETSNPAESTEVVRSQPAPEFHDLNEFPSLFSLKSDSKKTPLQTTSVSVPYFMSGIVNLC